ncbi:MAG: BrnA antitoxin family protein [Gallionella sp.]|nr:BrnA antitoxin family protein [Gallionella sp.]MDD4958626.1 BrnA antitoxin family protein [Gallionella sp.]
MLAAFRASGAGWQTRMNAALADWLKSHSPEALRGEFAQQFTIVSRYLSLFLARMTCL